MLVTYSGLGFSENHTQMALTQVFSYVVPAQAFENYPGVTPFKLKAAACFVSISPISTNRVRARVSSHLPDVHRGSSMADFNVISAEVLKQDLQSKREPRLKYYTKLVDRLAADGHLLETANLIAMLADAGIDRRAFMTVVNMNDVQSASRAALGGGHLNVFLEFVHRLHVAGFSPPKFVGNSAMIFVSRECRKMLLQGEVDKCVRLLTTLSECGFAVRRFLDVRNVITTCAKFRNLDAALRYARLLPMLNLHYNFIMQEFSQAGDMDSVFTAFTSMTTSGIKPDMYSYRSLIDACAHHGEVAKAVSVFQEIVSSGNIPNVYVYNSFMNVRAGDTECVWQLYADMQRVGIEPDLATYNIMLKSSSLSKSFDKAISLYKNMEIRAASGRLKLDVVSYTTMIHIFGDAKMWELALKVKEDMIASGVEPNVMTWTALMGACANGGMVDQTFSLFNEMGISGCAPNKQTYNMLIFACCKVGQHKKAFQLFNEWKETGQISAYLALEQIESVSSSTVSPIQIRKHCPDGKIFRSWHWTKIAPGRKSCLNPNLVTYNTLMKSCEEDPILVKEIMDDIVFAGLKPDLTSWSTYIDAYGSRGNLQEAINVFKNMKEEGIAPDLVVYTSIIKASVKAQDADTAFEYFRQLKEAGLRPNKVTYHTLFRAQHTSKSLGDVQRALTLYEEMREAGYAPNDSILRILLAQWADGAIEDGGNGKNANYSLEMENKISTGFSEYSKILLQRVAVHVQVPEAEPNLMIDLHGLSRGEARVAVLAVLRIIKERHKQGYGVNDDLIIITGVGKRSEVPGLPIIRQAVLHVLEKELGLPVKFAPTEVHIIHKLPAQISSEVHVLASELKDPVIDPVTIDTHYVSDESLPDTNLMFSDVSSDTSAYSKEESKYTGEFVMRKPTNFGRLIITKHALGEWLSKKHILSRSLGERSYV